MRRRSRVDEKLEKLSVADALNAVRFAEVVIVLIDVERAFEEQDQRIADLVEQEGRALVLAREQMGFEGTRRSAPFPSCASRPTTSCAQFKGVPLVAVSGLTGEGLDRLMQAIVEAYEVWNKRVPTSALNRWFEHAIDAIRRRRCRGAASNSTTSRRPRARPPSFVLFCTRADAVPDAYKRYLVNSLRETFDLPGTPIRLTLREKDNPFKGRAKKRK